MTEISAARIALLIDLAKVYGYWEDEQTQIEIMEREGGYILLALPQDYSLNSLEWRLARNDAIDEAFYSHDMQYSCVIVDWCTDTRQVWKFCKMADY